MTLPIFFGCNFIAFGPALGLFLFTIARDPLRIIILIAGSVRHRCRYWCGRDTGATVGTGVAVEGVLVLVSVLVWTDTQQGTGAVVGTTGAPVPVLIVVPFFSQ